MGTNNSIQIIIDIIKSFYYRNVICKGYRHITFLYTCVVAQKCIYGGGWHVRLTSFTTSPTELMLNLIVIAINVYILRICIHRSKIRLWKIINYNHCNKTLFFQFYKKNIPRLKITFKFCCLYFIFCTMFYDQMILYCRVNLPSPWVFY